MAAAKIELCALMAISGLEECVARRDNGQEWQLARGVCVCWAAQRLWYPSSVGQTLVTMARGGCITTISVCSSALMPQVCVGGGVECEVWVDSGVRM